MHAADATAALAHDDIFGDVSGTTANAYSALAAQTCDFNYADTFQLGGQTLLSGVHCFPSDALLNGQLNLTGNGPWILRIGTALTTGATSPALASVLVNGKANCNGGCVLAARHRDHWGEYGIRGQYSRNNGHQFYRG